MTIWTITIAYCDICGATAQIDGAGPHTIHELRARGWIMENGQDFCSEKCQDGPDYSDNPNIIWDTMALKKEDWETSKNSLVLEGWQKRHPEQLGVVYLRKPFTGAAT